MISVVIPTLNEEQFLGNLLKTLNTHVMIREIIVSDGGSIDKTKSVATAFNKVRWVQGVRGRANQMNYGASFANGEILIFLHADSRIEAEAVSVIPEALEIAVAGSCYLSFDVDNFYFRWYSRVSKLNFSLFTYGDQGLFMKKETFLAVDGFKNLPIMEDYDIVYRLKKEGPFLKLNYPLITSARRFERHGVLKQQIWNILLVAMYKAGVNPAFISRFYKY